MLKGQWEDFLFDYENRIIRRKSMNVEHKINLKAWILLWLSRGINVKYYVK